MHDTNQVKLLIIIPNLGAGGAQQVFRDQFTFYAKRFTVRGIVFNWDNTFQDDRYPNIISLDIPAGKNWFDKIRCFLKRVSALRKIKKQYDIDFCISHLEGADYVNLLSKRKEKVICWIHGTKAFDHNIEGTLGMLRKKLLIPLTYRLSDKIVTVSDGIRQELIQYFGIPPKKIKTIYNSFELQKIDSQSDQPVPSQVQKIFDTTPVLITHCRLSRQKNLFSLIDIFIATKKLRHVKLIVLGDGELRDDLLRYCAENNLRKYSVWGNDDFSLDYDIYFLGYERNPYPFLRRAAIYLMTSAWEGFPLSLCEAMACGVPVLAADCYTGPREILFPTLDAPQPIPEPVIGPYGILMPLANKETLPNWVQSIITLTDDTDKRNQLIKKGKERVQTFDRVNVSAQWLDVLQEFQH